MNKYLSQDQVKAFHEQGFLTVENILDESDLRPLRDEYSTLLDEVARRMFDAGDLSSTYSELPFGQRYTAMLQENRTTFDQLEISLPLINESMPPEATVHTGPAVFGLLTHPSILDVVESIIGPEIYSNPVQHLRLKPPGDRVPEDIAGNSYVGKTTWHQDQGALLDEADQTEILTVWVAITDATEEMGCLLAVPGSHRKHGGQLTMHCPGKTITAENYIPESLLEEARVTLPVRRGGLVLLNRYTEHAALPNVSDQIRWSFDLRYNPVGQPTGRPAFPGFVARSRLQPERVLTDPEAWARLWQAARVRLVEGRADGPIYNEDRWAKNYNAPLCA